MNYEDRLVAFQLGKLQEVSGNAAHAQVQYDKVIEQEDPLSVTSEDRQLTYDAMYRKILINLKKKEVVLYLASQVVFIFHQDEALGERALVEMANIYVRINEVEAAKDLLIKATERYPRNTEALFELARIYHHSLEEPEKAIPYYLSVANKTDGKHPLAVAFLADCYLAVGDTNGAKIVLERYVGVTLEETDGR